MSGMSPKCALRRNCVSVKLRTNVLGAKGVRKFLIILIAMAGTILAFILWIGLSHGFPFALMDLNDDGLVSPSEFVNGIDLGHRPASAHESVCTEIYRLKDGMPIKVVCEDD